MCESSGETSAVVGALEGLLLIQPFGMPLCKDKQSNLSQQAAAAAVDCRSHLGVELFSFRGKTSWIFESCFCWPVYIASFLRGWKCFLNTHL